MNSNDSNNIALQNAYIIFRS